MPYYCLFVDGGPQQDVPTLFRAPRRLADRPRSGSTADGWIMDGWMEVWFVLNREDARRFRNGPVSSTLGEKEEEKEEEGEGSPDAFSSSQKKPPLGSRNRSQRVSTLAVLDSTSLHGSVPALDEGQISPPAIAPPSLP